MVLLLRFSCCCSSLSSPVYSFLLFSQTSPHVLPFSLSLWPSLAYKAREWPFFTRSCLTIVSHESLCFFEMKQGQNICSLLYNFPQVLFLSFFFCIIPFVLFLCPVFPLFFLVFTSSFLFLLFVPPLLFLSLPLLPFFFFYGFYPPLECHRSTVPLF